MIFRLTCRLDSGGPPEEVTRIKSYLAVSFFGMFDDFGSSFGAASLVLLSRDSAVCLRVAS
jgi:hypothetical protein